MTIRLPNDEQEYPESTSPMEQALANWKKRVRDTQRSVRYSDAYRDGWRAAEWQIKKLKRN
jgi:hypothetical protein